MPDDLLRTALSGEPRQALAAAREIADLPADRLSLALSALRDELTSLSPSAQRRALLVCGALGPLAADLVPALLATLTSPRWAVREASLHALTRIDPASETVRTAAAQAALDRCGPVRDAAIVLLAHTPGQEVPAGVAAALQHHHARVRCRALKAVARLAPSDSVAALTRALTHSHYRVRRTAAELLGKAGPLALSAAGRLARGLFDGEAAVARAAAGALDRLRPHLPEHLEPLFGERGDPAALLAALLAGAPADLRDVAEATRLQRLARLSKPDPQSEARWLIGYLIDESVRRHSLPMQ